MVVMIVFFILLVLAVVVAYGVSKVCSHTFVYALLAGVCAAVVLISPVVYFSLAAEYSNAAIEEPVG